MFSPCSQISPTSPSAASRPSAVTSRMLISGGENVYPAEIESVLAEHPAIAEAAVIGVPDAQWGESGCVYVVAASKIEADEVLGHLMGRIARYKMPKHVAFVETLPRTGSGKVKKDELRAAFRGDPQR